jgi:hypothetical protein
MKSITRRVIAAAGALAMAGGVMVATAVPASAFGADTVTYAAQADGDLGFVELNHQHLRNDGDLTVTAIRVFTHDERISIGVVRCEGDSST